MRRRASAMRMTSSPGFAAAPGSRASTHPSRQAPRRPRREGTPGPAGGPRGRGPTAARPRLSLRPRRPAGGRAGREAALLDGGRPILVPAATAMPAKFERIAIAWKPSPQAARAVVAALPFLAQASEIIVATVEEAGEGRDEAGRLMRNLAWH